MQFFKRLVFYSKNTHYDTFIEKLILKIKVAAIESFSFPTRHLNEYQPISQFHSHECYN